MTPTIVPTDHGAPSPPSRRRRRVGWFVAGFLVTGGLIAAVFLVQLPYYVVQPGSVRPAESRIDIKGGRSYADDGEIMFTTVLLSRATPALMVRSWLDDAVEVRSQEEVYPDGDVDGARRQNLQRMDLSKLIATRVALDHIGIEAEFDANGARVLGFSEGSKAEKELELGDVIVAVDGGEVGMPDDIAEELADRSPGDRVPVAVRRDIDGDGEPDVDEQVELSLGSAPDGEGSVRPVLGVEVEPHDPVVDSPISVRVDSGEVSGPSAGLAWTLGIIDRLTPGALTDGRRIAVTGEIFDDGTVGEVGGVVQKVAAVKRAGIRLFLYPAATPEETQREMRRVAGEGLVLEPVGTIEEAVEVLEPGGVQRPD
jgi:PDZ domain-containing protein